MMRTNRFVLLLTVFGALVVVSACSRTISGTPAPADGTGSASAPSTANGQTIEHSPFTTTNACELLNEAIPDKHPPEGETADVGTTNSCQTPAADHGTYAIQLYTGDYADVGHASDILGPPTELHEGEINGRKAIQDREDQSHPNCMILMRVPPDTSMVVGIIESDQDIDETCDRAAKLAENIEPKLPTEN